MFFKSAVIELFAQRVISKSYDNRYINYFWNDKNDDFDFTNPSGEEALEIALIISNNTEKALEYEAALTKHHNAIKNVELAEYTKEGELICYYGGSMDEIKEKVIKAILKKEKKRLRRKKKYQINDLCLCIDEGGLFHKIQDFDFIIQSKVLETAQFDKLFLITSNSFFVIENRIIKEYKRII